MKLNVGDKVRVKKSLVGGSEYGEVYFSHAMEDFLGEEAIIVRVCQDNIYNISIDDECFFWTSDMFDKVDESNDKKILFAKMRDGAIIPSKREEDGCYDLYICTDEDVIIQPHQIKLIPTGICSTFPSKYRIGIRERGSNTKSGLITVAGQIDSNYTGEWFLALYNSHNVPAKISKEYEDYKITDEIVQIPYRKAQAQFAVELVPDVEVEEIELEYIKSLVTNRGAGCLGSSGK